MLSAALLILAMTPGVSDAIFRDGYDAGLCPAGRQTRANISYGDGTLTNVDVTHWENIWGRASAYDPPVPWPGVGSAMPTILNFEKTTYIAAAFHVPDDMPPNVFGWITHTEYNYGANLTATISTACGDFRPDNGVCSVEALSGMNLVPWRVHPTGNFCLLAQDGNYFLNLRITDPEEPSPTCNPTAPSCVIGTANNFFVP